MSPQLGFSFLPAPRSEHAAEYDEQRAREWADDARTLDTDDE